MKLLSGVFLTFFVCLVRGSEDGCVGEGVLNCFHILEMDVSPEEECGIVKSSVDCLRGVMEECLCDEQEKRLEAGLKKLEKLSKKLCPTQEEALGGKKETESLIQDIDDEIIEEKRKKCLINLSSKFNSTEERCREIRRAEYCLYDTEEKLYDYQFVWMISELEKMFVRRCEMKEMRKEKTKGRRDCPKLLTEDYGSIYSPGFRRSNTGVMDCSTRIEVSESKALFVSVDWLGIATGEMMGDENCTSEYVEIRYLEGFRGDKDRIYCRDWMMHTTYRTPVSIHFHSEDPINDMGYSVVYASESKRIAPTIWGMVDEIEEEYPGCVKENADSIFQCAELDNAGFQAINHIEDMGHNIWFMRCREYELMAECFVRRTNETCNETEVSWVIETVSDLLKRDPDSQKCMRFEMIKFPLS